MDRNSYVGVMVAAIAVALRKESVDRNKCSLGNPRKKPVALRKESVDRNSYVGVMVAAIARRSPQGERG